MQHKAGSQVKLIIYHLQILTHNKPLMAIKRVTVQFKEKSTIILHPWEIHPFSNASTS